MLHKLDFNTTQTEQTAEPIVDDERLVANNQPARPTTAVSTAKKPMQKQSLVVTIVVCVIAIAAGIGTGFGSHKLFATNTSGGTIDTSVEQIATGSVKVGDVFGSQNKDAFKDNAKGYLEKGSLDGEGSHRLLRPGGPSQTVYMTSSVTDLDKFEGMEVEVWGKTFSSQKAGWLMDVGRVEVTAVKGERPAEAEEE